MVLLLLGNRARGEVYAKHPRYTRDLSGASSYFTAFSSLFLYFLVFTAYLE